MSCSRAGTGHVISLHARHRMSVEDARAIYHAAMAHYVAVEREAGRNPYEKVSEAEACAFLDRQIIIARSHGDINADVQPRHVQAVIEGLETRKLAVLANESSGSAKPWITKAEIYAVTNIPSFLETAEKCTRCGRFMSAELGHECPTTGPKRKAGKHKRGDIDAAHDNGTWNTTTVPEVMPERTFGIETEFTGQELYPLARVLDWEITEDFSVSGGDDICEFCNNGFIPCDDCDGEDCPMCGGTEKIDCPDCKGGFYPHGGEMVSPILQGAEGLGEYHSNIAALKEEGVFVDDTCGIHVHVGAEDFTPETMVRLLRLWQRHEKSVFTMVSPDRRGNKHCADFPDEYVKKIQDESHRSPLADIVKPLDRYKALNVASFWDLSTVEYRLHHGSLDSQEVSEWAQFCVAFTEAASREDAASTVARADGADELLAALVKEELLDRATAESLLTRTGELPQSVTEPDVERAEAVSA